MLVQLLEEWRTYLQSLGRAPSTVLKPYKDIQQFFNWGKFEFPNEITETQIVDYHSFLGSKYKCKGTMACKSYSIRFFLRYLYSHSLILIDVDEILEPIRLGPSKVKEVFSEKEIRRILQGLTKPQISKRTRAIIELMYATGIRRQELIDLDFFDIDLAQGLLMVRKGKGNKDRVVPVNKRAGELIGGYMKDLRERYATPTSKALFIDNQGGRLKVGNIQAIFYNLNKRLSPSKPLTSHALRHAIATHLLRAGLDIAYVSRFLGHSTIESTRIYTHILSEDLKRAIDTQHPRNKMQK